MTRRRTVCLVGFLFLFFLGTQSFAADGPKLTEAQARLALRDVPKSVVDDYNRCRQSLRKVECRSVPVAYDARWSGKIDFFQIRDVVESHWDGSEASLLVGTTRIPARTNHDAWGTRIEVLGRDISIDTITPWIEVRVAPFGKKSLHERLTATAWLKVTYPRKTGDVFRNTTVGRKRAVSFYVVAPKELIALERLAPKSGGGSPWGQALGFVGAVAAVILLILVIRAIRHAGHPTPLPR